MKLALPLLAVLFLVGCTAPLGQGSQVGSEGSSAGSERNFNLSSRGSCGDRNDFFNVSPVQLTDFMGLVPLGNLNPSGHTYPTDHMYFHINRLSRDDWESGTIKASAYSPGDVTVTNIRSLEHLTDGYTDYSIYFTPCDDVEAYFIHLSELSDKLMAELADGSGHCNEYETGGNDFRQCEKGVEVELTAGEIVGAAGGGINNALDLGMQDYRVPEEVYANPERWPKHKTHVVCPLDYFTEPLRSQLFDRLGSHDGGTPRTIAPACGTIYQDVPGTAQGIWFAQGTPVNTQDTFPEDPHLALVHDNVDPSRGVFSVGRSIESIPSDMYYFDTASQADFDQVTPGKKYCYNTEKRFGEPGLKILIEMSNETTLKIGATDDCQNWIQAAEFVR